MLMLMMQTQSLFGKNIGKDNKPKNNKIIVRKNDGQILKKNCTLAKTKTTLKIS